MRSDRTHPFQSNGALSEASHIKARDLSGATHFKTRDLPEATHLCSSGNTRPQSSQFAEPPCTDPGLKSRIGMREPISTLIFFKGAGGK